MTDSGQAFLTGENGEVEDYEVVPFALKLVAYAAPGFHRSFFFLQAVILHDAGNMDPWRQLIVGGKDRIGLRQKPTGMRDLPVDGMMVANSLLAILPVCLPGELRGNRI